MIRRVLILTAYFSKTLFFSLTGLGLLIGSLVYWALLFPPGQHTPDIENYIILIGALGAAVTFIAALSIGGRANRLENYPVLVRLPSRVEYLTAVLLSALLIGFALQGLVALLALIRGPALTAQRILWILPLWLSLSILAGVLALHASDLVVAGWSRVIVFGILALLLILNSASSSSESWLSERFYDLSTVFTRINIMWFADVFASVGDWLAGTSLGRFASIPAAVFWPLRTMLAGVLAGGFTAGQALAPAVLLLYGAILFLIAAVLFSGKDLEFVE